MRQINRGERLKLQDLLRGGNRFNIVVNAFGPGLTLDFACFGIDASGKLSDDRYMTFFNQPTSPCGGVSLASGNQFAFDLDRIPAGIDRLVLTAALDGPGTMGKLNASSIVLKEAGQDVGRFNFSGTDFQEERALMLIEIYRKDGKWRMSATAQGFNGGLDALVRHFGGEVSDSGPGPAAPPVPASNSVNLTKRIALEKRMATEAPQLLSLTKSANVSLEKVGLGTHKARFCAVFDISWSMEDLYDTGEVQAFAERALAMGCRFDDDGEMDIFLFGANVHQVMTMNIGNYKVHLRTVLKQVGMEGDTQYGKAVQAIRRFYFPENDGSEEPKKARADTPVYVVFQTDGDTARKDFTERQIRASSYEPIYWQFVGLGRDRNFSFLRKLDDLKGRLLDNTGFFEVSNVSGYSDDVFFDKMVAEYSQWVIQAKHKGLIV